MKKNLIYLTTFLVFLDLFLAFLLSLPEYTQDLGELILLGKIIVNTGSVMHTNLLSYAFTNYPYLNSQWLSEVILYLVNNYLGIYALRILGMALGIISFLIVYLLAIKRAGEITLNKLLFVNLAALVCFILYFPSATFRPALFSFLMLSVFLYILYKFRENGTKLIFLLIPLELIWVNLHIYFITGEILIGIFLLSFIWDNRQNIKSLTRNRKVLTLLFVLLGSFLASFISPNFQNGAFFPFTYSHDYGVAVQENQSLLFFITQNNAQISYISTSILIAAIFLLLLFNKKREFLDVLIVIVFGLIAISSVRNIALFAIVSFPFLAYSFSQINFLGKAGKIVNLVLFFVFFSLFFYQINYILKVNKDIIIDENTKIQALDFFEKNNLRGPIYNDYGVGSYIAYRMYPKEKPFIDSRPEAYPATFFKEKLFSLMMKSSGYFEDVAKDLNFNTAILFYIPDNPTFINNFITSDNWKLVFLNSGVSIFVRNNDSNKEIIKKFEITKNKIRVTEDVRDESQLLPLAYFFNAAGWTKAESEIYKEYVANGKIKCVYLKRLIDILKANKEDYKNYQQIYNAEGNSCDEFPDKDIKTL